MHRQSLNAGLFGDAGDDDAITAGQIPAGANLQRHWNCYRCDHRLQNAPTSASSRSSADPASAPQTFLAGQPMLRSMICAP
jgi:hypothetical protein